MCHPVLSGGVRGPRTEAEAEAMAAAVWRATWPVERIRQRAFNTFGMDVLLALDLQATREFFAAFFSMSDFHWCVPYCLGGFHAEQKPRRQGQHH